MLRILIVDDDNVKVRNITKVVREVASETQASIDYCSEVTGARKLLFHNQFDLLLLDIQLPLRLTDIDVQKDGGIQLLSDIKDLADIKLPRYVIGFTSFEDTRKQHEGDFEFSLWPIIHYGPELQNWRDQLKSKIQYLLDLEHQLIDSVSTCEFDYDLAIITAVPVEHRAVRALPAGWEKHTFDNDSTEYWTGYFESEQRRIRVVHASQHQMGMTAASTLTMKLITHFRPRYLSMTGILAGYKPQTTNLGDIIIAAESWDFGSGKIVEDTESYAFLPEPHQLLIDVDLKEKFLADCPAVLNEIYEKWPGVKPATVLQKHVGAVASGAAVIQNAGYVDEYIHTQHRKLLGIDMETYGVYYAAHNSIKPRPLSFSMKSVCDFADAHKSDDYQAYASYTSAQFLYKFACDNIR